MRHYREFAQDLNQILQAKLGGSTGAVGKLGETQFAAWHQAPSSRFGTASAAAAPNN
jgi:hypothetical protein